MTHYDFFGLVLLDGLRSPKSACRAPRTGHADAAESDSSNAWPQKFWSFNGFLCQKIFTTHHDTVWLLPLNKFVQKYGGIKDLDSIVNNGIHFNGIFIRNGDTTGMESSGIYGENQFYRIAGSPKKMASSSRKIVFQSHGEISRPTRASFSGQCLALSHLDSSFAEPGRHYQMVWCPLFWRGSICFKNYRNELPD